MKTTEKRNRFLSKPLFLLRMFSVVLALGLVVAGCDKTDGGDDAGPLAGTWKVTNLEGDGQVRQQFVFTGSNYTYSIRYAIPPAVAELLHEYERGTFTYNDAENKLILTPTSQDTTHTGNFEDIRPPLVTLILTWGNATSFAINGGNYAGTYLK